MKNENKKVIIAKGVRVHNLKNIDVTLPKNKLIVFTGVSGSGKSSLAFDTLFAEGQRRYIQSFSIYSRQFMQQMTRPDVDSLMGLSPTVSVEQKSSSYSKRSTVGTVTELYDYLRLLYAQVAKPVCPICLHPIQSQSKEEMVAFFLEHFVHQTVHLYAPLVMDQKGSHKELLMQLLRLGLRTIRVDEKEIDIEKALKPSGPLHNKKRHSVSVLVQRLKLQAAGLSDKEKVEQAITFGLKIGKGTLFAYSLPDNGNGVKEYTKGYKRQVFSEGLSCPFQHGGLLQPKPSTFSFNSPTGACEHCHGLGMQGEWLSDVCMVCHGDRLKKTSLCFLLGGKNIAQVTHMPLLELVPFFKKLSFSASEKKIADHILQDVMQKLQFLIDIGVGYLSMNRSSQTLSGGELQRMRLATQIGSQLTGVTYVLDEPSIGLHQKDHQQLIWALQKLRDQGNTVIVVEHDEETMRAADYILDLGPHAGHQGGKIVVEGSLQDLLASKESLTGQYLRQERKVNVVKKKPRIFQKGRTLELSSASINNLKNMAVTFPLGVFICVTGVSGSGKSSLVMDTLYARCKAYFLSHGKEKGLGLQGLKNIDRVIEIDQSPVGLTSRSNPATYIGVFGFIRKLYAQLPEAKMRGYDVSQFSFNKKGGTCATCGGLGVEIIQLQFLPDTTKVCSLCDGNRYSPETLDIYYHGKNIKQVLDLTITEAVTFFSQHYLIRYFLEIADQMGLGYLTLGQSLATLSGGECQRIKIVEQLSKKATGSTLYILDEPSTGLHFYDVSLLLKSLEKLVDAGNTVIVIEHHLDVIEQADYIIDLGPGAGALGGTLVAAGSVADICAHPQSATGKSLKERMKEKKRCYL